MRGQQGVAAQGHLRPTAKAGARPGSEPRRARADNMHLLEGERAPHGRAGSCAGSNAPPPRRRRGNRPSPPRPPRSSRPRGAGSSRVPAPDRSNPAAGLQAELPVVTSPDHPIDFPGRHREARPASQLAAHVAATPSRRFFAVHARHAGAAAFIRSQSHTSLGPMACVSWAKSIAARWLGALKLPALASTPVSRAILPAIPRGMSLRIRCRTTSLDRVGCLLFIYPCRAAGTHTRRQPIFLQNPGDPMGCLCQKMKTLPQHLLVIAGFPTHPYRS